MKRTAIALYAAGMLLASEGCAALCDAPRQSAGRTRHAEGYRPGAYTRSYPVTMVRPDGRVATVMPPAGGLAVAVNPDGSHSTAIETEAGPTIVTP